jgi:hypothetical protein
MTTRKRLFNLMLIASIVPIGIQAQNGTVASGGEATGSGGKVSYSIGQVNYISVTNSGGQVNQGLQQPFEIYVNTGIEETNIDLNYSVYPNPAKDNLNLKIVGDNYSSLRFVLTAMDGKLLMDEFIKNKNTTISMQAFANGTYVLSVLQESKKIKSYNIIKN